MSSQRYERISSSADDDHDSPIQSIPSSPPPSFRSRTSSFSGNAHNDNGERQRLVNSSDADRTLADTFDAPSDDESDDGRSIDERQRAMSGRHDNAADDDDVEETVQAPQLQGTRSNSNSRPNTRRGSRFAFWRGSGNDAATSGGARGGPGLNDGVFANMAAKPERGNEEDEKPPSYEQAAADATPPYWETTILTPSSTSDEVFIDGLPVGSFFSFIWNGMISLSFQLVGFLLTYLLHTTHAAKNGSKAGLGITLIQYGFNMKRDFTAGPTDPSNPNPDADNPDSGDFIPTPDDPNNHNFDPNASGSFQAGTPTDVIDDGSGAGGIKPSDWFAYALMIVGWFILIRSLSEYIKARRHEQLVLQSPSRGLNVPVVAEGETSETVA